ncbi:MAG TPA: hypothetical protein GXZ23_08030 [Clostridiales bacterium]|nr:hypothetical protein [Clostridiales bacterium]
MLKKIIVALVIQLVIAGIIIASPTLGDYYHENCGTIYECKVKNIVYSWKLYNNSIIKLNVEFDASDLIILTRWYESGASINNNYDDYISINDNLGELYLTIPIDDAEKFYEQFPDNNPNIRKEHINYSYYTNRFTISIDDSNSDSILEFDGSPAYVTVVIQGFLDHLKFDGLYVDGEKITQIKHK